MQKSKAELYKRNYLLLVLEGAFFAGGVGFFSSSTVIPVFIDLMTHSKQVVGLTLTLGSFLTYFGRLLIGPFMPHVKNHSRFVTILMFICRPQTILPALMIFLGYPMLGVVALIFSYSFVWAADGLVVPGWSEVLANTVDGNRHGRLLGLQMLIGGIASIGAGILINIFLNNPRLDIKIAFAWIFLIGGLLLTASCFMMAMTENAPVPYKTGKIDFIGYYKSLPKYLKLERDVTRMLMVNLMIMAAGMCVPFVILFAKDHFGMQDSSLAKLILIQSVGAPLGGWLWGQICDRFGSVAGIKTAVCNMMLIAVLPLTTILFPFLNPLAVIGLTMFLSGVSGGIWTCNFIYTVQVSRPESRSSCIVLSSVLTLPVTFSSYLAGFVADRLGYVALFLLCTAIAAAGLVVAQRVRPVKTVLEEREFENQSISAINSEGLAE